MANTLHSLSRSAANNKSDVLKGTPHDDVLHGSLGHTTFYGGLSDDIYYSKTQVIPLLNMHMKAMIRFTPIQPLPYRPTSKT